MNEDFGLDVMMEDLLNGGYGYILDAERFYNDDVEDEDYEDEDYEDSWSDVDADADTLASAGWGTDEDYGYEGDDSW